MLQFQVIIVLIFLIGGIIAPPNPVLDNTSDISDEENPYRYPKFDSKTPYWHAFPKKTQAMLKKHDHMEVDVLKKVRNLDFKLREAWTRYDKPFIEKKS